MTDRDKAVELLARGLASNYEAAAWEFCNQDEYYASATALLDQLAPLLTAQAVRVMPLVWEPEDNAAGRRGLWFTALCKYSISKCWHGQKGGGWDFNDEFFPTLEAAKAAAQADYEACILSAIEAVPLAQAVEAERAACTEELRLAVAAARVGALQEAIDALTQKGAFALAQSIILALIDAPEVAG